MLTRSLVLALFLSTYPATVIAETNPVCAEIFTQSLLDDPSKSTANQLFIRYINTEVLGANVYGETVWFAKSSSDKQESQEQAETKLVKLFRKKIIHNGYISQVKEVGGNVEVTLRNFLTATLIFTPTTDVCRFGKISARFLGKVHELNK